MKIVFSHANSFPASTYGLIFKSLKARGFAVSAIEKFGHDPKYPVTDNWPHLVQQLIDFAQLEVDRAGEPVFLVGHSFGGFVSLMAAALAPALARGVLLVDSPILGGWRATTFSVMKSAQLVGSVSPGATSRRRRISWPSQAEAIEHFRHKKAFAHWHPQVLQDYIAHGTHDQGSG
ncbi:MAG: alpha/beta fold hydrolase, partial [Rhodoferax sp.]